MSFCEKIVSGGGGGGEAAGERRWWRGRVSGGGGVSPRCPGTSPCAPHGCSIVPHVISALSSCQRSFDHAHANDTRCHMLVVRLSLRSPSLLHRAPCYPRIVHVPLRALSMVLQGCAPRCLIAGDRSTPPVSCDAERASCTSPRVLHGCPIVPHVMPASSPCRPMFDRAPAGAARRDHLEARLCHQAHGVAPGPLSPDPVAARPDRR